MQCTAGTRCSAARPFAASRRSGTVAVRASVTAAEHVRCVEVRQCAGCDSQTGNETRRAKPSIRPALNADLLVLLACWPPI